jgi:gliding-associated putative ABC transporter substrate-binding component GldG
MKLHAIVDRRSMIVNLIIFLAIMLVINLCSLFVFQRFDLSRGHVYSLGKASKQAVKGLKDKVVIRAYFSKELPGELADAQRYTKDLLTEYQVYSKGKLSFEFVNNADPTKFMDDAKDNGMNPLSANVLSKDKWEQRLVFMGLSITYLGKTEIIPEIQSTEGLEYQITSKIRKITGTAGRKVAFFAEDIVLPGINMAPAQDRYTGLRDAIGANFKLVQTDLATPLDSDVGVLLFSGVQDSISTIQAYNLDQFIMRGGKAIILQSRNQINAQMNSAWPVDSNIFDMLESYGIYQKDNIVLDANCYRKQYGPYVSIFPFMPMIDHVSPDSPITTKLSQLLLSFPAELDTTKMVPGQKFQYLMKSSYHSGLISGPPYELNFDQFAGRSPEELLTDKPKNLAGLYTGKFNSFFTTMPPTDDPNYKASTDNGTVLFVSDANLLDFALRGADANLVFLLNAIDYLSSDAGLIEIRSRGYEASPLKEGIEPPQRAFVKWVNILLPALLLIGIGFMRATNRREDKKRIETMYE